MIDPTIVTGIFTIIGTIAGSLVTFNIASQNARAENQRQLRELGFRIAMANYDHAVKQAIAKSSVTNQPAITPSISMFVAEGIKIAEIVGNPSLNAYEIGIELRNLSEFPEKISKGYKR